MDRSTLVMFGMITAMLLLFAGAARFGTQAAFDGMADYHDDLVEGRVDQGEVLANLQAQLAENERRAQEAAAREAAREAAYAQSPAGWAMSLAAAGTALVVLLGLAGYLTITARNAEDEPLPRVPAPPPTAAPPAPPAAPPTGGDPQDDGT